MRWIEGARLLLLRDLSYGHVNLTPETAIPRHCYFDDYLMDILQKFDTEFIPNLYIIDTEILDCNIKILEDFVKQSKR